MGELPHKIKILKQKSLKSLVRVLKYTKTSPFLGSRWWPLMLMILIVSDIYFL
jgi:hypothetical protein